MVLNGTARVAVTDLRGRARSAPFRRLGVKIVKDVDYGNRDRAAQVRELLARTGLSQREAARELECSDRLLRYYCAGKQEPPRMVILALERLVDMQRRVAGK